MVCYDHHENDDDVTYLARLDVVHDRKNDVRCFGRVKMFQVIEY